MDVFSFCSSGEMAMMHSVKNVCKEICTMWFKKNQTTPSLLLLPMGIRVSLNLTRDVERSTPAVNAACLQVSTDEALTRRARWKGLLNLFLLIPELFAFSQTHESLVCVCMKRNNVRRPAHKKVLGEWNEQIKSDNPTSSLSQNGKCFYIPDSLSLRIPLWELIMPTLSLISHLGLQPQAKIKMGEVCVCVSVCV